MSLFSSKKSDLVHWSVDFVEHLRAVHFGLIALCVILILVISGKRDAMLSKAINEAIEIEQLRDEWKAVDDLFVRSGPYGYGVSKLDPSFLIEFESSFKSFPSAGITVRALSPSASKSVSHPWIYNYESMKTAPRSLTEFRTLWNDLHNHATVRIAVINSPTECTPWLQLKSVTESRLYFSQSLVNDKCDMVNMMLPPKLPSANTEWSLGKDKDKADRFFLEVDTEDIKTGRFEGELHATLTFRFTTSEISPDVLRGYFPDVGSGAYETAFPELVNESKGLEVINLSEMVNRLKDKQGKGDQNIEVIGLKLPNEDLNRWGIVLLLSVQFYFWLHLHELNKKIDGTSPGWDVAWIGMYSSLPAVITMWISTGALPVAAVGLLASRNPLFGDKHVYSERFFGGLIVLVSAALVIATIERLHVLKMSRPVEHRQTVPEIPSPS
jgi:hypothetical protein